MITKLKKAVLIALIVIGILNFGTARTRALEKNELQSAINQRSTELQQINNQIKEHQKNLEEVQNQNQTLQQEIKKIDSNINQANLSIRSSEITIDKLGLEIDSLQYDIGDAEKAIAAQKKTITKLIQEVQQKDGESPLVIFLKNKSLAEGVFEVQSISDLNAGLSSQIEDYKKTKAVLSDRLNESAYKKQATEEENKNLKNKKLILGDVKNDKKTILTQSKNQEKVYQKLISDLEKRQLEIASEIEKMEADLRLKVDPSALPAKRSGVLATPVQGILSQNYGATSFAVRGGYRGKWHNGLDYAAPIGTPVYSAEKGTVIATGNQDKYCYRGAYGKFIVIKHENNLITLYGHLSLQTVREGDIVKKGSLIGYVGKTGYATGPHLHFTVYASQTFRMGPSRVCGPMPLGGDLNPGDYL
jgi:murein DD-endopeptidase MepM/ murein hydrolase activator NlpD